MAIPRNRSNSGSRLGAGVLTAAAVSAARRLAINGASSVEGRSSEKSPARQPIAEGFCDVTARAGGARFDVRFFAAKTNRRSIGSGFVRALRLYAIGINVQGMFVNAKAAFLGDFFLARFDCRIEEFFHASAL